jgi:membrane peptidoglycan carboxypeptidase
VEISGEERGRIPDPSSWSKRSLVTQAFGQEISVTALQLAAAYGAVANGGLLMRPYLVREVRKQDGTVLKRREPEIVRRALHPQTARTLREMMRLVITQGTGTNAEVEGRFPAGKTGTGQKFLTQEGCYSTDDYIASFAGFAPYDSPQWVCVVVLDQPRASIWGGSVAAPVFSRIIDDVAQLDARATESPRARLYWPAPEKEPFALVPKIKGLTAALARRLIKQEGLFPCLEGRGSYVVSSRPEAGSLLRRGDVVKIFVSDEPDSLGHPPGLPDFRGLALRDVIRRTRWHDLTVELCGSGWVVEQDPEPGAAIESIDRLCLWLSADSCRAFAEWLSEGS